MHVCVVIIQANHLLRNLDSTVTSHKALGASTFSPDSQNLGIIDTTLGVGVDVFTELAHDYVFIGKDRVEMCKENAMVCFSRNHINRPAAYNS